MVLFQILNNYRDLSAISLPSKIFPIPPNFITISKIKDQSKIIPEIFTIEDYLLDIQLIPRIDLLCVNSNNLQTEIIKEFESLIRFINFIVVDFSSIVSKNIDSFYSVIKTLENNNHKVYFQTSTGLIPISRLKIKIYGIPIKLIGILIS